MSRCPHQPRTSKPHLNRMDHVRVGVVEVGHVHDENDVVEALTAPQQVKAKVPVHNVVANQPQQLVRGRHGSPRLRQRKVRDRRRQRVRRRLKQRREARQRPWLNMRQEALTAGSRGWRRLRCTRRRRRTRPVELRHAGSCTRPQRRGCDVRTHTRPQSASLSQMRRVHTRVVHIAKCLAAPPPFYFQCPTFETTSDE
jgi:hypothetical protein